MKVFVTGRNGFIAKNIITRCIEDGYTVMTSSRDDNITERLNDSKPDIIFHLAMEGLFPEKMVISNIGLTHQILEYCRVNPVKKLLLFGSSSEYGCKDHPITEKDILEPKTMYEGTKAAATMLARSYAYCYNIPIVVIRPMSIYGPHEKDFKLMKRIFLNELTALNHAMHDWTYIDDFVEGTMCVMKYEDKEPFDIVNIGLGVQRSNHEVVAIAEKLMGYKIEYKESKEQLGHGTDSLMWVCDPTYLKTKYGFTPTITLEEGMAKQYRIFKASGY
jgi:nucleoside-diphosphate-sugar epimerase